MPADSQIIEGEGSFDESSITGESIPIHKSKNHNIYAGSINTTGYIKAQINTSPGNSVLDNIIKLIQQAQGKKPSIQNLADLISSYFVPVVLVIAAVTFIVWMLWGPQPQFNYALLTSISVLVIACPCAIGLATPTAITVGLGKTASNGILVKTPDVFENLGNNTDIVFDKTGTLTEGKFEVADFKFSGKKLEKQKVVSLIYALEKKSTHPIAESIVKFIEQEYDFDNLQDEIQDFKNIQGMGMKAKYNGKQLLIGNLEFLKQSGIDVGQDAYNLRNGGRTVVAFAYNDDVESLIVLEDKINEQSKELIEFVKSKGIKTWIASGDNDEVVQNVADRLGVDFAYSKMLPDQKYDKIAKLQKEGKKVMMVGDGINDSPSLTLADIGVAMGSGSDIALTSGDVVLLGNNVGKIKKLFEDGKKTLRVIYQNFFWAFLYNIILIPVAGGVIYPIWGVILNPLFAGLAMALSSISVVLNSLRLKIMK
ncbi:heavy metal translocating P-type ATPase [Candidatus Absconditicoccus praedator]|uniref:heavy metal translocating P-type ATPase n=1 Tax=Candidatus Absconditicoccus praedator TaxID=2735562 RepID=UPI001E4FA174|nr:heavy metal translocating P-type ATPase [Candidatus Absconditicoccus praedator]